MVVHFAESLDIVDVFLQVLYFFQLFGLVTTEESIPCGSFEQDQHRLSQ